jgi:hypothetical protein
MSCSCFSSGRLDTNWGIRVRGLLGILHICNGPENIFLKCVLCYYVQELMLLLFWWDGPEYINMAAQGMWNISLQG